MKEEAAAAEIEHLRSGLNKSVDPFVLLGCSDQVISYRLPSRQGKQRDASVRASDGKREETRRGPVGGRRKKEVIFASLDFGPSAFSSWTLKLADQPPRTPKTSRTTSLSGFEGGCTIFLLYLF